MSSRQSSSTAARPRSKETTNDNFKSMGLKAGVLAVVAGLAFYPKFTSEANTTVRSTTNKGSSISPPRRRERRIEDDHRGADLRRRESLRPRDGEKLMRVDEYDMRRGEGFSHRDERRARELRMMRRESADDQRRRQDGERQRRCDDASIRSAGGSDRTKQWVTGGYEYLSGNEHRERDRRRW